MASSCDETETIYYEPGLLVVPSSYGTTNFLNTNKLVVASYLSLVIDVQLRQQFCA